MDNNIQNLRLSSYFWNSWLDKSYSRRVASKLTIFLENDYFHRKRHFYSKRVFSFRNCGFLENFVLKWAFLSKNYEFRLKNVYSHWKRPFFLKNDYFLHFLRISVIFEIIWSGLPLIYFELKPATQKILFSLKNGLFFLKNDYFRVKMYSEPGASVHLRFRAEYFFDISRTRVHFEWYKCILNASKNILPLMTTWWSIFCTFWDFFKFLNWFWYFRDTILRLSVHWKNKWISWSCSNPWNSSFLTKNH